MGHYCFLCDEKISGGVVPTTCKVKERDPNCAECQKFFYKEGKKCNCVKNDDNKYCGSKECHEFYNTYYSHKKCCIECNKIKMCNKVECYCVECWKSLFEDFKKVSEKVYKYVDGEYKLIENEVYEKVKLTPKCPGCEKFYDFDKFKHY